MIKKWLLVFFVFSSFYSLFIATKSLLYLTECICMSWLHWKMGSVFYSPPTVLWGRIPEWAEFKVTTPPSRLVDKLCDRLLPLSEFCLSLSVMWMHCFRCSSSRGECVWSHLFLSRSGAATAWACPWFTAASPRPVWCIAGFRGGFAEGQLKRDVHCLSLLKGLACVWSLKRTRRPCIPLTTSPARRWVTRGEEKRVKFAPSGSSKEYTFQESNAFMPLPRNLYRSKEQRESSQGLFSLSSIEFDRPFNMQPSTFLIWSRVRCRQGLKLKLCGTPANGEWIERIY